MEQDKRIGTYNEDGTVAEWPETSVTGSSYNRRIAPRTSLNKQQFVVLPAGFKNPALIDEMRKQYAPAGVVSAPSVEDSAPKRKNTAS